MTAPVPTHRNGYDFHPGDEQSRDAALRAHYGRLPGERPRLTPAVRTVLVWAGALAGSLCFWAVLALCLWVGTR